MNADSHTLIGNIARFMLVGSATFLSTESIDPSTKIQNDPLSIIRLAPESASRIGMVVMGKRHAWVMPSRTDT